MQGLPAQPCAPSIMHFGHNRDTKPCRFYKFSPWYNSKNDGKKLNFDVKQYAFVIWQKIEKGTPQSVPKKLEKS